MTETFRVMFQTVPPHPAWTAYRHRSLGTLTVTGDHARFVTKTGDHVLIERVSRVSMGWKESAYGQWIPPLIDSYIEVVYGDRDNPAVAYINDGRWFGLAIYLRHRKLLSALSSLLPS